MRNAVRENENSIAKKMFPIVLFSWERQFKSDAYGFLGTKYSFIYSHCIAKFRRTAVYGVKTDP